MKQRPVISVLLGRVALTITYRKEQRPVDSWVARPATKLIVALPRKEIAQNVLAAQPAEQHQFEAKTTCVPTDPIQASLCLTGSSHGEHIASLL